MNKGIIIAFVVGVLLATFVAAVPATIKRFSPVG